MPAKILLADKSITIQKVVEMLFSGREYDVACVSDGESALQEAQRNIPDVVLADVDLPRIDGYSLAMQLKKAPGSAGIPIILMMSRDDVYDNAKGKQAGIVDKIVKPFESQELIGKVKKALTSAPPRPAAPARAASGLSQPAAPTPLRPQPSPAPKPAPPADIFDIISDAPTRAELKRGAAPAEEESIYEVEPVVEEVEAPVTREEEQALPTGPRAMEEMRAGLGLIMESESAQPEIVSFESFDSTMDAKQSATVSKPPISTPAAPSAAEQPEVITFSSLDMAREAEQMFTSPGMDAPASVVRGSVTAPDQAPVLPTEELRKIVEETVSKMAAEAFKKIPPPQISAEVLRTMAAETISKMSADIVKDMAPPPLPKISDETIRRGIQEAVSKIAREIALEVIEKVAWEIIPPLAEHLINEEIERLKKET
jgi:DNA-binding response OmpR family regulator